jgi:DMSO/TMAO reductase YedYZ heme-binding membrane subunit
VGRIIKNKTFLRSSHVVGIGCLTYGVAHDVVHVLKNLDLDNNNRTIKEEK